MLRCEFHCHSIYSKDSLSIPKKIIDVCIKKRIDRIAITDHDTIRGALEAQKIDPQRVIVGEEISTTSGELLAYFIKEEIPSKLSAKETIRRLQMQDAFISVAHPFDTLRQGHWQLPELLKILPDIDAIEIFNARCMVKGANQSAYEFAQKYNLSGMAGSDAHILYEIGRALLVLPAFDDKNSLSVALKNGTLATRQSGLWVHLFSRYAKLLKILKNP
jgi:predicted metal-dependent phosphoesterase TrpH